MKAHSSVHDVQDNRKYWFDFCIIKPCWNVIWLRWMVFVTEVKETSSRTDLNSIEFSSQTHIIVMVGNLSNDGTAAGLLSDAWTRALW